MRTLITLALGLLFHFSGELPFIWNNPIDYGVGKYKDKDEQSSKKMAAALSEAVRPRFKQDSPFIGNLSKEDEAAILIKIKKAEELSPTN